MHACNVLRSYAYYFLVVCFTLNFMHIYLVSPTHPFHHSSPSESIMTDTVTATAGTKVDAGTIAAPFRAEVREKVEELKKKGFGTSSNIFT